MGNSDYEFGSGSHRVRGEYSDGHISNHPPTPRVGAYELSVPQIVRVPPIVVVWYGTVGDLRDFSLVVAPGTSKIRSVDSGRYLVGVRVSPACLITRARCKKVATVGSPESRWGVWGYSSRVYDSFESRRGGRLRYSVRGFEYRGGVWRD